MTAELSDPFGIDLPTSNSEGKWVAKLEAPKGFALESFRHIVSAAYTAYIGCRGLPSVDQIYGYTDKKITKKRIAEITLTDEFREAMENRGIRWSNYNGIDANQQYLISILTNPVHEKKTLQQKLKLAGVPYSIYRGWLRQPTFNRYLNELTEGMLTDHIGDLHTITMQKALSGDLNAIKYVHELSGRHDPNRQQVQDVQKVIEVLIEVVTRNVTDQETLQRIATEMQLVMQGKTLPIQTVKGELSDE